MARRYPRTGFNIGRPLSLVTLLLAALVSAPLSAAKVAGEPVLQPYLVKYSTSARGMTVTLERELKDEGEGRYTLTNGGKLLVVGFHEVAVFSVEGSEIHPKSYIYQGTGLINRRREVHFTPGSDTVRSLYKDEWYELPYTEGTLDRMSQQEQLRLQLMAKENPRENLQVRIADGKRIRDYELVYVGEEVVDTPLGPVNTLHFERLHEEPDRESAMWLAPDWDYLMVKTIHVEDDKPVEVLLAEGSMAGTPLQALVP
ncbi:MAG: hypothetical protein CME43_07225 [Haliea sp.]|uniref:DUF3108 domain-containing protein n=1 Tax=Haliea sp. TaxID=1932666 RepID=UPI000C54CE00|nr:DUF3108 domain-containing protein [Haliea sp.]MBM69251.1 hypothetical protein [Haliea sp.]